MRSTELRTPHVQKTSIGENAPQVVKSGSVSESGAIGNLWRHDEICTGSKSLWVDYCTGEVGDEWHEFALSDNAAEF